MSGQLLSPSHIQKLGHPIEEIRVRALSSVLSKYNLLLVDETNLENTKQLLQKLFDWFSFDRHPEEDKVLNLILKIIQYENSDLILKEIGSEDLIKKLNSIERKLSSKYHSLINDIKLCIAKTERNYVVTKAKSFPQKTHSLQKETNFATIPLSVERLSIGDGSDSLLTFWQSESKGAERLEVGQGDLLRENINGPTFRLEYFPWQNLVSSDRHVVSSIYEGLRYIDNKTSILQSCQFFSDVILKDFPAEIFIQRPLIIQTFFELLECEDDVRIPVILCLIETIKYLKIRFYCVLDLQMVNHKQKIFSIATYESACHESDEMRSERSGTREQYHININSSSECDAHQNDDLEDEDVSFLQKHQSSLPNFCFIIIFQSLPHLAKDCGLEECNLILTLIQETLSFIAINLKSFIWFNDCEVKEKLYQMFGLFQEALKFQKTRSKVTYLFLLSLALKMLDSLKMPSQMDLGVILPRTLQLELANEVCDFILIFLYPNIHKCIMAYVRKLIGQKEKEAVQDYKDALLVCKSMEAAMKVTSNSKFKNKFEKLKMFEASLLSLDYHKNYAIIKDFIKVCLLHWPKLHLTEKDCEIRDKILIKLLSHSDDGVKKVSYKEIRDLVIKHLGVEEAVKPTFDHPGDKMEFLFNSDIFMEIICHGLNSNLDEIPNCSNEIMIHLLKSKYQMSEKMWKNFLSALIPCLPLLQCYADKSTPLGRCVTRMLDPDVAAAIDLSRSEVMKGNLRLLFSKDSLTRYEAVSRLCWLLTKDDPLGEKLPKMSILRGVNLSSICSSVKPQELVRLKQSFYSAGSLCDVVEMLCSIGVEPSVRRSALSQISVMMEDITLHSTFLEQNGLEKILNIFDNCLVEKEFHNYPDSVIPIMKSLKLLVVHNALVRQELSVQTDIYYYILRSLFLFSNDDKLRQDASELLYLLLYNDVIINVPPSRAINCKISLPELVIVKMCVPFLTHIHWRNSRHLEPSIRDSLMKREECARLIRIYWTVEWMGNLSLVLAMEMNDLKTDIFSPELPVDMKLTSQDLVCLKKCALHLSVKQKLYNIQNATTHDAVIDSIQKLQSYMKLYKLCTSLGEKGTIMLGSDVSLSELPWQVTLERFLTSIPSCQEDETLLFHIIQFVQLLLRTLETSHVVKWMAKLLTDETQSLPNILKTLGNEDYGIKGREIRHSIIDLTQDVILRYQEEEVDKWLLFMNFVSDNLNLNHKEEFYNVAFIDWLLSMLVDLTGNWKWDYVDKIQLYEDLATRVMEIVVAFHCTKDSSRSFMGVNIVKSALLILNQLLSDLISNSKGWEQLWLRVLCEAAKHDDEPSYSWLLSLWFVRDPVIRAASLQLVAGFALTPRSCELLLEGSGVQFEHIWNFGFQVLLDRDECCLVREKCAILLSNLTSHGCSVTAKEFLQHLIQINLYREIELMVSKLQFEFTVDEVLDLQNRHLEAGDEPDRTHYPISTTPSLLSAISVLLLNVIYLNPPLVIEEVIESGLYSSFLNLFANIPLSVKESPLNKKTEIFKMYINVGKIVCKCVKESVQAHFLLVQSQPTVNSLFKLIDYELYLNESKTVIDLRNNLWKEIFDIFSLLLKISKESINEGENKISEDFGMVSFKTAATKDRLDYFVSSLYLSMLNNDFELRKSSIQFLINLLCQEGRKRQMSGVYLLNCNVTSDAAKMASLDNWRGFVPPEKLSRSFAIRASNLFLQMYTFSDTSKSSLNNLVSDALAVLLASSKETQGYCLDNGLIESMSVVLKQLYVKLSLETVDNLRKTSEKKRLDPQLNEMENLLQLTCNFLYGNGVAKKCIAGCGFSDILHKLWPWCNARVSLLTITLKMLCTYTYNSSAACHSLVLTSGLSGMGLKKSPGSSTLIHAVMNQVIREMDLISKTHNSQVLQLSLQLLSNCCIASECRTVIGKGPFLQCINRLHPSLSIKRRLQGDDIVDMWFTFLIIFSAHQEGQLSLSKSSEILELLILTASNKKKSQRVKALKILRNVCCHNLNRLRMLSCCSFLTLMMEVIESQQTEEICLVLETLWALSYNSQKAKLILRTARFEDKLRIARKDFNLSGDEKTLTFIDLILSILQNK